MENLLYSLFNYFDKMPHLVSFVAGILSFLSPCVLPLVPIYFFYITGISTQELKNRPLNWQERVKIFINSLLFVAGFGVVFILLGLAAANIIGNLFNNLWVSVGAGIVIILFGLHLGGFLRFKFLQFEKRLHLQNVGSFLLGVSFALGWTPCIGPIFGTIVGIASTELNRALVLMVLYVLGLALPFLIMAIFTIWSMKIIERFKKHLGVIEKISGILLILVGVYLIVRKFI
ncbi:MAG: cytochrome C biogenesis protein [Epsilonproteobacteria bacterium]|nr:cytochrome C biogenesis protein [Campylobacterota bacterium]NPA89294.1 cytochrome C biogenesis protein [Campylobacterota bacterium]